MPLGRRTESASSCRVMYSKIRSCLSPARALASPTRSARVAGEAAEGELVVGYQQGVEVGDRAVGTVEVPGPLARPPGGGNQVGSGEPGPVTLHEKGPPHGATVAPPRRRRIGGRPYVCPTSTLWSPSPRRAPSSARERIPSFR